MPSNYKRLGDYIQEVNFRNTDLKIDKLIGVSIEKKFISSVANIVGTDMSVYKIIKKNQLACKLMSVGRDEKLPVDLYLSDEPAIISSAYYVFESKDHEVLLPEYLKMWLFRTETDRYVGYISGGDVRGGISWDTFCDMPVIIPSIEKQREIVREYNTIQNRIALNNQLISKLEDTAQAIYKHWFVDFEFPDENGLPYKSNDGKMTWCNELDKEIPTGWLIEMLKKLCDKIGSGSTPKGGKESYFNSGISLIRSMNIYDFNFSHENLAFIDNQQADKLKNVEVIENDILFNITGVSVARCCMVPKTVLPARVNQHVMIIRPKEFSLNYYLLCTLCSNQSKNELLGISQSGSTREAITKVDIENFKIVLPHSIILKKFDKILSKLFTIKDSKSAENQKLEELKDLLLARMTRVESEK
jgi:type I restriction enzyme S subunit